MTEVDITWLVVSAVVLVVAALAVAGLRWRRRDQEFVGLTPGLLPTPGQRPRVRRVRGGQEWKGPVAVAFAPPGGIGPAVAGTVVDGKVDGRDLAAMLVDLSLRGFFRLEPVDGDGTKGRAKDGTKNSDWLFVRSQNPPSEPVSPAERRMLDAVFRHGPQVKLSVLKDNLGVSLREVQIDLYREMINRGWYRKHPRSRSAWTTFFGIVMLIVTAVLAGGAYSVYARDDDPYLFALPAATLVASILLFTLGRGRSARTAEGTAARIQTLGFERYLATAEAGQIRYEEAAGLFTRYLPFAIMFGLADRWAKVVGDALRQGRFERGLDNLESEAGLTSMHLDAISLIGDVGQGIGALIDLGGNIDVGLLDVSDAFEGFTSSASDLFDSANGCGDGCDGCDGCDLGCIDF